MANAPEISTVAGEAAQEGAPTFAGEVNLRLSHPRQDLLLRFMGGKATRPETCEVVRHLLVGCRECLAVTRPVWSFADERVVEPPGLRSATSERDVCLR